MFCGPWTMDKGPWTKDKGQRTMDKGQRKKNYGLWTMDYRLKTSHPPPPAPRIPLLIRQGRDYHV